MNQYIIYDSAKRPRSPLTGEVCDPHDPRCWADYSTAQAATALGLGEGIGFVFTPHDPYFFLDIDHCAEPGGWSLLAQQICQLFSGCYVEISRSGTGLHVIGTGSLPAGHRTRCQALGLEIYTSGRYCALTGRGASGSWSHPAQAALDQLYDQYFRPLESAAPVQADWTEGPCPEWNGPTDDEDLIARMLASRQTVGSVLGNRGSVQELWEGSDDRYANDHSSADAALCQHLAFWTGRDCERMDRLFRRSGLMRDKWADREDYGRRTILHAVTLCQRVYGQRDQPAATATPDDQPAPPAPSEPLAEGWRTGHQILTVQNQVEYFRGCVYVRDQHRILVPDGGLLKPEQFRAVYGGYQFALGADASKTTKSAWEALTESQGYSYPWAHDVCFRPEVQPGAVLREEGRSLVNIYVPVPTEAAEGDVSRFTGHVERLLPDAQDREILLAYMAALVQHPGVKFQWAPLIQGVEGNGKTLLFRVVEHAVGRRYTHLPKAQEIGSKFNAWLLGKLFIGIEEVYTADKQELIEALKPLITNDRIEIEGKGANQLTADNRANFLLSSNHMDGIRKTENDRRYAPFYTAQQEHDHLRRDGMQGSYFPELYRWLRSGGYAAVNHWLRTYQIPDALNPAVDCHRAPRTSSTAAAIACSRGGIEQEVLEAIETGIAGFCGGWVSSLALDRLLDEKHLAVRLPRTKRRKLLQSLGYDYHPALLPDGRVNNPIGTPDNGKPKLYCTPDHPARGLRSCAEVIKAYTDAQTGRHPLQT